MCKRISEVHDIELDKVLDAYKTLDDIDDDTGVQENCAWTQRFGNPYDWRIYTIPPIPGSKVEDKDSRFLLLYVSDQEIQEAELFVDEDSARSAMFERFGDVLNLTPEVVVERHLNCYEWADGTALEQWAAKTECFSHHAWTITPVDN